MDNAQCASCCRIRLALNGAFQTFLSLSIQIIADSYNALMNVVPGIYVYNENNIHIILNTILKEQCRSQPSTMLPDTCSYFGKDDIKRVKNDHDLRD